MEETEEQDLFVITRGRMYSALCSFYIWKWLNQAITIQNVDEECAKKNVEIMNRYKPFLHQVLSSSYKSFISDLSIFFDAQKYKGSLSLGKLIKLLKGKLSEEDLSNLRDEIDNIKKKHGVSVTLILDLRNSHVAHQSVQVRNRRISYLEIEELFAGVQEILNLISKHYDGSMSSWGHVENEVKESLQLTFDNLERGSAHKKEIR